MSAVQGRALKLIAVTAADADFTWGVSEAVMITGAGTLVCTDFNGSTAVTITPAVGIWHPMNVRRIAAASTATGIVAQY